MNRFKAAFAAGVLALIYSPAAFHSQNSLPNLRPHQPRDWSNRIVVSSVKDTHSDSSLLRDTDDLFVDFAVINAGPASVTESFRVELFVDGRLAQTFESERSSSSPLMSNCSRKAPPWWELLRPGVRVSAARARPLPSWIRAWTNTIGFWLERSCRKPATRVEATENRSVTEALPNPPARVRECPVRIPTCLAVFMEPTWPG